MNNFYCKPFNEDGMMSNDEKCTKQCEQCRLIESETKKEKEEEPIYLKGWYTKSQLKTFCK